MKRKKLIKKVKVISYKKEKTLNRRIKNNVRRNLSFKKEINVTMSISKILKFLEFLNSEWNDWVENRKSFDLIWHVLLLKSARFINLNLHSYYFSQYHIYVCFSLSSWQFNVRFWRRILMIRRRIRISFQNEIICIHERTISFRFMSEQTDKICLKSSQKQTTLSSKKSAREYRWTNTNSI